MARFYLIDHSLINGGGHHFDYATCVVEAANEIGFNSVIAANKKVSSDLAFEQTPVVAAFEDTVYHRVSSLAGLQHLKRVKSPAQNSSKTSTSTSSWQRTRNLYRDRQFIKRRTKTVATFSRDCQAFFAAHPLAEGDQVFLTTVSELELLGLANFFRTNPSSMLASWHLQFHFNVFDGRPPEYGAQKETERRTREAFELAQRDLSGQRLFFYTSSEPLAEQYNRLQVGEFVPLPYPVAPEFALKPTEDSCSALQNPDGHQRALRFTCPGQIRREKSCKTYLQPLINEIWDSHLATGKVKVAVQRPRKKFLRRPKIELKAPDRITSDANSAGVNNADAPLPFEYFAHPLSRGDYLDLIRSTDCGLLLYDSRVYYSRRAGVLGELLACGKPLIVLAGSWLADQISEPIFKHADELAIAHAGHCRTLEIDALEWDRDNAPSSGGVISFDCNKHPFLFSFNRQPDEHLLKIDFQWQWPKVNGTYCRIEVVQKNGAGEEIASTTQIVGHRLSAESTTPNALFRLRYDAETVNVKLSNAYESSNAMIRGLKVQLIVPDTTAEILGQAPHQRSNSGSTELMEDFGKTIPVNGSGEKQVSVANPKTTVSLEACVARTIPLGSVGIIVADIEDAAAATAEMAGHYEHYHRTALDFSKQWSALHHPNRTVAHLMGRQRI